MRVLLNKNLGRWLLLVSSVLLLTTAALGQGQSSPAKEREEASGVPDIEHYLDRLIATAVIAGDSASAVKEAGSYRAEATQKLKSGSRDEARALLRQAGEVIAAAAPDGDIKQQDPLLREYLREITRELVALDGLDRSFAVVPIDGNLIAGNSSAQPRVATFLNYFQGRGRSRLEIGRSRLALYRSMMTQIFRDEGVPEWLLSVGFVESTYNTGAHSPKAAHGIWQFIPGTGDRYGLKRTAWTDDRGNPEKSTRAAARYLRDLHALFGDWLLALAAYNTGENRVARVIHRTGIRDFWTMAERGLLPQETINYVPSVLAASRLLFGNSTDSSLRPAALTKILEDSRAKAETKAKDPDATFADSPGTTKLSISKGDSIHE
jgi:Transglycosylase SLT domain